MGKSHVDADGGPAVNPKTREIDRTSVSQIEKFDPNQYGGCNRKWWFDKVMGFEEERTRSTVTGSDVHKHLDHHLTTGSLPSG